MMLQTIYYLTTFDSIVHTDIELCVKPFKLLHAPLVPSRGTSQVRVTAVAGRRMVRCERWRFQVWGLGVRATRTQALTLFLKSGGGGVGGDPKP